MLIIPHLQVSTVCSDPAVNINHFSRNSLGQLIIASTIICHIKGIIFTLAVFIEIIWVIIPHLHIASIFNVVCITRDIQFKIVIYSAYQDVPTLRECILWLVRNEDPALCISIIAFPLLNIPSTFQDPTIYIEWVSTTTRLKSIPKVSVTRNGPLLSGIVISARPCLYVHSSKSVSACNIKRYILPILGNPVESTIIFYCPGIVIRYIAYIIRMIEIDIITVICRIITTADIEIIIWIWSTCDNVVSIR